MWAIGLELLVPALLLLLLWRVWPKDSANSSNAPASPDDKHHDDSPQ